MRKKRNGFWTFCFSCLPGAGQMFQGFMRRGVSLMVVFFGILALTSFLRLDALIYLAPVIWFYAFFDAMNLHALDEESLQTAPDDYLFLDGIDQAKKMSFQKYRTVIAVVVIIIGGRLLLDNVLEVLSYLGFSISWEISNILFTTIPQILIALLIIAAGFWMIRGKKQELLEVND